MPESHDDVRTDQRPLVFHMIDSLDISGGAERQLVANLRSFDPAAMRHEVVVIKPAYVSREQELDGVAPVTSLFAEDEPVTRLRVARRLRRLVQNRRPDLIHVSLATAALAARVVGRLEDIPVVESLVNISHEPVRTIDNPAVTQGKLRFHTLLDRLTMRWVKAFHAVSEAVADSWTNVVGIPRTKIRVIPRGVDVEQLHVSDAERDANRTSVRAEFGLSPDTKLIIAVGRVEPQKGHRYLVEALSDPSLAGEDIGVLIVGRRGLASATVESAVRDLELDRQVRFTGPRRDIPRLLSAADIFVFPSLFEGNGGNAMIEAMAAGLAIITTGSPPMTDLIPDHKHGILVPRAQPAAIAKAIRRLLDDDGLRGELGARAVDRALGFRRSDEIALDYENWYRALLGGDDGSRR